ncbi:MAG: IS3 family transposase, partial [Gemmatimonadales bacterium]
FTAAQKAEALAVVGRTQAWTGWTLRRILRRLGLSKSCYYAWRQRAEAATLDDLVRPPGCPWQALPEEVEAVTAYALARPRDGYRRLAWMMVDEDVAYLSPSTVYRILDGADLLARWKRSRRVGTPPPEPTRPHQRWHTDIMYLRVADTWYFLVTVLDAYSRYVVHWDLLASMTAAEVRLVVEDAVRLTGAQPEVITDNGSQFTAKDFKELVRRFGLEHIRIRVYHPESNGKLERYHRSTRDALDSVELQNLGRARELIGRWVAHYNTERLHAALNYLPPVEFHTGNPTARLAERRQKLEEARQQRRERNNERLTTAA